MPTRTSDSTSSPIHNPNTHTPHHHAPCTIHPHHVYISYASPRVKSRGASSEEKKEEVREKDNEQHRTAYHQLGDDGKEARAKKNAD